MLKLDLDVNLIIDSYNNGQTIKSISVAHNCSQSSILRLLRKYGVKSNPKTSSSRKRKYYLNEDFFNEINSQEKAYILGYLYADGHNNTERGTVNLTISSKDEQILYDIRQHFTEVPIKQYVHNSAYKKENTLSRLRIDSWKISQKLEELGCGGNKTFTLQFPSWLSREVIPHFIRGYLDGDGWISISKKNVIHVGVISSDLFCEGFSKLMKETLDINFTTKPELRVKEGISTCFISSRNTAIKFLDWLYKDASIYLDRKYQTYLTLKSFGTSCYGRGNKGVSNKMGDNIKCPRCSSSLVSKRGFDKGKKRYQCNSCNKSFMSFYYNSDYLTTHK
jgi:hypothetical protein